MKRTFTSIHHLSQLIGKAMALVLLAVLAYAPAFGQGATDKQFGDLSGLKWKASAELDGSILTEQSRMAVALSSPTLAEDEKALYKAYLRLLDYVQSDLQDGKPVDEAIENSYKKVMTEAVADPELKNMPDGHLFTYIPGLIETLMEAPKPVISN